MEYVHAAMRYYGIILACFNQMSHACRSRYLCTWSVFVMTTFKHSTLLKISVFTAAKRFLHCSLQRKFSRILKLSAEAKQNLANQFLDELMVTVLALILSSGY